MGAPAWTLPPISRERRCFTAISNSTWIMASRRCSVTRKGGRGVLQKQNRIVIYFIRLRVRRPTRDAALRRIVERKTRIMIYRKVLAILPAMVFTLTSLAVAADSDINVLKNNGSLD